MPDVCVTRQLRNVVPEQRVGVVADDVFAALNAVFVRYPRLKGYLLDDQGNLRKAIRVYRNGRRVTRHAELRSPIDLMTRIDVF